MDRKLFLLLLIGALAPMISAAVIQPDLHVNIQTTDGSGNVITGTYDFVFNITTDSGCSNVVYSDSANLATDSRGIISYYLEDVNLDYSNQYWLCYYRDGQLINNSQIARTPYAFRAEYVNLSGVQVDSNLDLSGFNATADYFFGSGKYLTDLNVSALDMSAFVPYTGSNQNVDLGSYNLSVNNLFGTGLINFENSLDGHVIGRLEMGYQQDGNPYIKSTASSNGAIYMISSDLIMMGGDIYVPSGGDASDLILGHRRTGDFGVQITTTNDIGEEISRFRVGGGNDSVSYFTNTNVGIGTTSPSEELEINGTDDVYLQVKSTGSNSDSGIKLIDDAATWQIRNWGGNGDRFAVLDGSSHVPFQIYSGAADNSLVIRGTGRVGINTTNPQNTLNVVGDANVTGVFYVPEICLNGDCQTNWGDAIAGEGGWNDTGTQVELVSSSDNVSAGQLFIDNSAGYVGIGTANPEVALDVDGIVYSSSDILAGGSVQATNYMRTPYITSFTSGGNVDVRNYAGNTSYLSVNTTSGNVGIGTSNPQYELDVTGTVEAGVLKATSYVNSNRLYNSWANITIDTDHDYNIILGDAGTGDIYFKNAGNVGIGKTPSYKLDVNGSVNAYDLLINGSSITSSVSGQVNSTAWNRSGTNVFLANTGDSVSIGSTSSAGKKFRVVDNDSDLRFYDSGAYAYLEVKNNNKGLILGGHSTGNGYITVDGALQFLSYSASNPGNVWIGNGNLFSVRNSTNASFFDVLTNGNVGIGTTTPQNKLNIIGDGNFTGVVYSNGSQVLTSYSANLTNYVPYTGATQNVDLGSYNIKAGNFNVSSSGAYLYDGVQALKLAKGTDSYYANVMIGNGAGNSSTQRQTAIGYQAGYSNTKGSQTAIGYRAGYQNTGNYQTAIGSNAGRDNSGIYQFAMGYSAGQSNTGDFQIAIGRLAGQNNNNTVQTAIGDIAGQDNIGSYQTAIGGRAGYANQGNYQTAIGSYAGYQNTGSYSTSVGYEASRNNSGSSVSVLGLGAGQDNSGSFLTAMGRNSGRSNIGTSTSFYGYYSGYENTGDYISSIGYQSAYNNSGSDVIALGYQAGKDNTASNKFIVQQANVNANPLLYGDFATGQLNISGDIYSNGDLVLTEANIDLSNYYNITQVEENLSNYRTLNNLTFIGDANVTGTIYQNGLSLDETYLSRTGDNGTGEYNFNGGWTDGGLSIRDGDLYAQTVWVYNISSLQVSNLNVNGSLLPHTGFDNQFDVGSPSLRWKDGYFGGNLYVNGTVYDSNGLVVNGNVSGEGTINYIPKFTGAATLGNSNIYEDGTGKVGIGTSNPQDSFVVSEGGNGGEIRFGGSNGRTLSAYDGGVLSNFDFVAGSTFFSSNFILAREKTMNFYNYAGSYDSGYVEMGVTNAEAFEINLNDTNSFLIDSDGKVGIGTSNPQNKLNVIGDGNFTGSVISQGINLTALNSTGLIQNWSIDTSSFLTEETNWNANYSDFLTHTTNASALQYINSTGLIINWSDAVDLSGYVPYTGANQNLVLGDNNLSVGGTDLFVDSNKGYIGIGTSSPVRPLEVSRGSSGVVAGFSSDGGALMDLKSSGANQDSAVRIQSDETDWTFGYDGVNNGFSIARGNNYPQYLDSDFFIGNTNGNIGIGTTNTQNKLNVVGDGNFTGYVMSQGINLTALNSTGLIINWSENIDLSGYVPYTGSTSEVVLGGYDFSVNTSDLFVDVSTGRVGIGTSSPSRKLDVNGSIQAEDVIYVYDDGAYANVEGISYSDTSWHGSRIGFTRTRGSASSRTAVQSGDTIGWFDFLGWDGNSAERAGQFALTAYGSVTDGIVPGRFTISTTDYLGNNQARISAYPNDNIAMATYGGSVGIGTGSPNALLTVVNSNASATEPKLWVGRTTNEGFAVALDDASTYLISDQDENSAGYGNMFFQVDNDGSANGYFNFGTKSGGSFMRIASDGDVGIGTTNPLEKLHVNGNVIINGTLNIDSNKIINLANGTNSQDAVTLSQLQAYSPDLSGYYNSTQIEGNLSNYYLSNNPYSYYNSTTLTGVVSGSGTAMRVPLWNGTASLNNSNIYQGASGNVGIGIGNPDNLLTLLQSSDNDAIKIYGYDDQSSEYLSIGVNSYGQPFFEASGIKPLRFNSRVLFSDDVEFTFGNDWDYSFQYDSSNANFELVSTNVDGVGTDGNIIQVYDGTDDVIFSGNVGIGTTSPQNKLNVIGDGNFTGDLFSQGINLTALNSTGLIQNWSENIDLSGYVPYTGANQNLVLGDNNFSVGGTDLFVDSNKGYLGIGTSSLANSLGQKLAIRRNDATSNGNTIGYLTQFNRINSDVAAWYMGSDVSNRAILVTNNNDLRIGADQSGDFYDLLYIDWDGTSKQGLVGINTTTPQNTLNVIGDGNFTGYVMSQGINLTALNSTGLIINWSNEGVDLSGYVPYTGSNSEVVLGGYDFSVNTSDLFVDVSTGRVGIGTTSPSQKLSISGNVVIPNSQQYYVGGLGDTLIGEFGANSGILQLKSDSTRDIEMGSTSYPESIYIEGSNGNVGIGTASPQSLLHIAGTTDSAYSRFTNDDTGHTSSDGALFGLDNSENFRIHLYENKNINFYTNNQQRMTILSGGNVGIGTTSPGANLEVNGATNPEIQIRDGGVRYARFGVTTGVSQILSGSLDESVVLGNSQIGPLQFGTNNIVRMTLDSNGNLGLGTTSPSSKLDVRGTLTVNQTDAQPSQDMVFNASTGTGNVVFIIG